MTVKHCSYCSPQPETKEDNLGAANEKNELAPIPRITRVQIYEDELRFLVELKKSVTILNNRIHDKLSLIAIEHLTGLHPHLEFRYFGAAISGFDIEGFSASGERRVIAEVKTTQVVGTVLKGPQKMAIVKDLRRMSNHVGTAICYLVLISDETVKAVTKQVKPALNFPAIKIIAPAMRK